MRPQSPIEDPFSNTIEYGEQFFDAEGAPILFSAGESRQTVAQAQREDIEEQMNRLLLLGPGHSLFGHFSDGLEDGPDSVDGAFSAALSRMGLQDDSDTENGEDEFAFVHGSDSEEAEWLPHGSRTMFMLDLLDNLPRLRLSDDHLKAIIWVMRECKTPNVLTFSALRKKQASMTYEVDIKSTHHTSSLGNHFYMNHPSKLLAFVKVSGPISEFWQAGKWTSEISLEELSPMWADWRNKVASHRHFYVNEMAQQRDGTYVIPLRWITVENIVHADIQDVQHDRDGCFHIKTGGIRRIPAQSLAYNYLDLQASLESIHFTDYSPFYQMPHPLREKAQGRPIFQLRVMPWSDDVSGNVSKQYNAHTNMYVTNVRFISTSPHASSSEQFVALGEDLFTLLMLSGVPGTWHEAYDCELEQEILFEIIPHVLPADNPQQSETASHIGMGGNLGCRRDLTGGPKEQQESDHGYRALYAPGVPRDKMGTVQIIRWQIWTACSGDKSAVEMSYSHTGIKDKIPQHWIQTLFEMSKERQAVQMRDRQTRDPRLNQASLKGDARKAVKQEISRRIQLELWDWVVSQPNESFLLLSADDPARLDLHPGTHPNILLETRGLDPHQDIPVEILHTYLLGNDKYVGKIPG
ncbi:hypothetical protein DFH08DRAFT_824682 [Mycena albidolilacea]|uniref:Uncharacterized protein n=1 Tax=Mycena albidolilacea TaxID=1033008 RepID=A0AAD6Z4T2_9AGAR|nr:hypothetical protein DFH08DRAFT_824682 [Mycena albidolilacea]